MKLKLVEWKSYTDGRDRQVSDWDNAVRCEACGNMIVHVYTLSNGMQVGKQCAMRLLSVNNRQLSSQASKANEHVNALLSVQESITRHLQSSLLGLMTSAKARGFIPSSFNVNGFLLFWNDSNGILFSPEFHDSLEATVLREYMGYEVYELSCLKQIRKFTNELQEGE